MFLKFAKLNPNGNITILVLDPVSREAQADIADRLMAEDSLQAEQVGFLETAGAVEAEARLQMMGGEFCGNATMALAAWMARRDGMQAGETKAYALEVSGSRDKLACSVTRAGENCFRGEVPMPLPEEILETEILPDCRVPLVRFPGIVHAILPEGSMTDVQAESMISRCCAALKAEAMGFIFTSRDFNRIRPLVYVRSTDTFVWENGCGSGTAALGAWRAAVQGGRTELEVKQPDAGSCIGVTACFENGKVNRLSVRGKVSLIAMGEVWVDGAGRNENR